MEKIQSGQELCTVRLRARARVSAHPWWANISRSWRYTTKPYSNRALLTLLLLAVAAGSLWLGRSVNGQTVDPKQIVDGFYPQRLRDEAAEIGGASNPDSSFDVFDSFADGTPRTIIAGYTDLGLGAVRVIRAQTPGSYGVVFEPLDFEFGGDHCGVELIDVDGNGTNEIKLSFVSSRGVNTMDWLFRWDGTQLVNLTPISRDEDGTAVSEFTSIQFVDLLHDGTLQVRTSGEYPPPVGDQLPNSGPEIYRLTPAGYELDKPVLYVGRFERRKGEPQTRTTHFTLLKNSTGPYVLRLANGRSGGQQRVSSARIVLNNVEALSPNLFSQQVEFLEIPVELVANNKLEVTLAGEPLGFVTITIEGTTAVNGARQAQ